MDQWGHSYFGHLPHWPFPPPSMHCLTNLLQGVGVGHSALKAGGNPSKRHAFCLFVDNFSGAMSIPMDPPYCLVYPTSYVKGVEPDHFNTRNSPAGTWLHRCLCHATLQFSNNDPKECTNYVGSHLILPRGVQYNNRLFLAILELWNHCSPLIDPTMGSPI